MTLECTEARGEGGTPSRYTTQKVWLDNIACSCALAMPQLYGCLSFIRRHAAPDEETSENALLAAESEEHV